MIINRSLTTTPETKNCQLNFQGAEDPAGSPMFSSNMTLGMTEADAEQYVIGNEYTFAQPQA